MYPPKASPEELLMAVLTMIKNKILILGRYLGRSVHNFKLFIVL